MLYYKVTGLAEKSAGVWNYDFETIKINKDLNYVRVGLSAVPEMILKEGESRYTYQPSFGAFESIQKSSAGVSSDSMARLSNEITYGGGHVETANSLDPWESYHVTGEYSESYFALYWGIIVGGVLGALLALCLLGFAIFKIIKYLRNIKTGHPTLISALTGIVACGVITATFFLGLVLLEWIDSYFYGPSEILILLFGLVWVLLMLVELVVPPILLGSKYGGTYALVSAGITIIGLTILAIILFFVFFLFAGNVMYY